MTLEEMMDEAEGLGCYWGLKSESIYGGYICEIFSFRQAEVVGRADAKARAAAFAAALSQAKTRLAVAAAPRHVILSSRNPRDKEFLYCANCQKSWSKLPPTDEPCHAAGEGASRDQKSS